MNEREELKAELMKRGLLNDKEELKSELLRRGLVKGSEEDSHNKNSSPLHRLANSPLIHSVEGAQDEMRRILSGGKLNFTPQAQGRAYDIGKLGGDVLSTYLGGKLIGPASRLILGNPTPEAQALGQRIRDIPYNAAQRIVGKKESYSEPEFENIDPLAEEIKLVTTHRLQEPPPSAPKISSDKLKQEIVNSITKGRSLEENGKEAAKQISSLYKQKKDESSKLYQDVFGKNDAGNINLLERTTEKSSPLSKYTSKNPKKGDDDFYEDLIKNSSLKKDLEKFSPLSKDLTRNFNKNINVLYYKFLRDPTFKNAHELKSQIGSETAALGRSKIIDPATREIMQTYKMAQNKMDKLIKDKLEKSEAYPDYLKAGEFYRTNVVPFRQNRNLYKVAKGEITNPAKSGKLASYFSESEPELKYLYDQLGPSMRDKILHSAMGSLRNSTSAQKILDIASKLENKGLGQYLSRELSTKLGKYERTLEEEKNASEAYKNELSEYEGRGREGLKQQREEQKNLSNQREQIIKEHLKEYQRAVKEGRIQHAMKIKQKIEKERNTAAAIGTLAGAAVPGAHVLGGAVGGALGYLSRPILEKVAQAIIRSREGL